MRDKLIELIQNAVGGCARHWAELIADHIIANGVIMQRWIPVSERLPEHGVNVLCMTMLDMRVMHWHESAELWVDDEAAHTKRFVEYWMLIPEDPKEGE